MDFRLRRYVWVADLIGMLAGAALAGHLVAKQIVDALSPLRTQTEQAKPALRPRLVIAPVTAKHERVDRCARSAWPVGAIQVGILHYEISRAFVDTLLADLGRLSRGALIVPATVDGQPIGVRIFGNRGGLLPHVGLASGDLVLEANGFPLTHPSAMLDAYAALRRTSEPWLVIERGGRRILLTYTIVE